MTDVARHELSSYQRDIWVAESLLPGAPQLTCALHEHFRGPIDVEKLTSGVRSVLERNDAFRLRFDEADGVPQQWTEAEDPLVQVLDLRNRPDPHAAGASWREEMASARFTLRRNRLYQAAVLRESDTDVHLYVRMHHIIMDAWGMRQFTVQVLDEYTRSSADVPPDPVSYLDFVASDEHYRGSAAHERDTAAVLAELSAVRPALFGREADNPTQDTGYTAFVIDGALVTRMRERGSSPFSYVAAVLASWLTSVHGTEEVVLGVPLLNRRSEEERRTPGLFTSLLPLRVRADGSRSMKDLAGAVRTSVRTLQEHSRVGLGDVLSHARKADTDTDRLFDVTVTYIRLPEPSPLESIARTGVLSTSLRHRDALSVVVVADDRSADLRVELQYARAVFDDAQAESIGGGVLALVTQSLQSPDSPVAELDWATSAPGAVAPVPDRTAQPAQAAPSGSTEHVLPRNDMERELATVWAEVLGHTSVGVHDNYFVLGGDSITMLRLRARCLQRGIRFSLTDLMQGATVAQLATRAVADTGGDDGSDEAALAPFELVSAVDRARLATAEDAFPVSRVQLGLIYHSREHENSSTYHDVFQYTLGLPWREDAFRAAFGRLVGRHPALRSSFALAGFSQPLQVVHTEVSGGLSITDLRTTAADAAEATIRAHADEQRHHLYVFDDAPLYLFQIYIRPGILEIVFSFHHVLFDGGSVANLMSELLRDYAHGIGIAVDALSQTSQPSPAHYVRDEALALASDDSRQYWRRTLEGAALPELDGFRSFEPPSAAQAESLHVPLPEDLTTALRTFATDHQVPVKSLLFAAYCLTLQAQFGARDYVTGLVTHGRPDLADAERMVGLFVNTMPVRVNTEGLAWLDVARSLYSQEQRSHPHRRFPLSEIHAAQDASFAVESCFNYVHFHVLGSVLRAPGVRLLEFLTWEETNFRLLVNAIVDPLDQGVSLRIDFDARVLTQDQAEAFGRFYREILARMTEKPKEQADFAFLSGETLPRPRPSLARPDVVRAFADQVARTPDAVAVRFGDSQWTYAELDEAADRVAAHLRRSGTRPGDRVGIAMDRSVEVTAVVLGIARAGAAGVPLDTTYPVERLRLMLRRARPATVVAHRHYAHLVGEAGTFVPAETALSPIDDARAESAPAIAPEDMALLLFTSGSTGVPKGVAIPHRYLAHLVAWQTTAPSAAPGGATLQFAPLSFDVCYQEIFSTICSGGTLVIVPEDVRRDPAALLRLIESQGVERVFMPYVALQQLAEASQVLGLVPGRLRVIVSGGEQLRMTDEIRRLCNALPDVVVENHYGPTETHVVCRYTMTGDFDAVPELPPVGNPVDGAEVHLLDEELRPVPDGVKGEIYIGGPCVSDGYFEEPELTSMRFLPHPRDSGSTLYRTGDIGVRLAGGAIASMGRADNQVKVRGFRVEPGEVETAIMRGAEDTGLRDTAVVARRRNGSDAFLAAFLVGDPDRTDLDLIRKNLRKRLPDYMVPARFTWITRFPLTPSGKRDNAALRRLPLAVDTEQSSGTPPRDAHEGVLADVVAELLHLPSVGVDDNLFDLGATSLTVMRLVMLVKQRYNIEIPMSGIIAAPTVADLAGHLRSGHAVSRFDPLVPFRTEGTRPPMYFVHPGGGNVLCFVQLAKHLPSDQPFYGLQAAGTEAGTEPLTSVPELARSYLSAIRRVQPHGPYTIGGWSFGGMVALEMAQQLRAAGQDVANVFLLDTVALKSGERSGLNDTALLGWFFWELLYLKQGSVTPEALIPHHLSTLEEKFDYIANRAVTIGVLPRESSGSVVRRLFKVYQANWQAAIDYADRTFDTDFTLLHAMDPLPDVLLDMHRTARTLHQDPHNGWDGRSSGRLTVLDVPGDHLRMMEEPHVSVLAAELMKLSDTVTGSAS
jgi:amino acid adenylation domain-containing protein